MSNYEPQPENVAILSDADVRPRFGPYARALPWILLVAAAGGLTLYEQSGAQSLLRAVSVGVTSADFWKAAAVGLVAQVVDGALGMAYGITSTSFLLSVGVPPAAASASVHLAEVFTTGFSGLSHWKLGNVNKALFRRLLIPGVVGGLVGAYVLTSVDGKLIRPWLSGYLLLMGIYILIKAFKRITISTDPPTYVAPLALAGGFIDAVGGGGWGPVVATTLLGSGQEPRRTIGSVNAAEFFVAVATGFSLALLAKITAWTTIGGLVIGGMFAAPFAAVLTKYAPTKVLMIVVSTLIIGLSLHNLASVLL
jgi:uncharacterized protein